MAEEGLFASGAKRMGGLRVLFARPMWDSRFGSIAGWQCKSDAAKHPVGRRGAAQSVTTMITRRMLRLPQERAGVITMKGNARTLLGAEVKVGDKAPDFTVVANDLSEVRLADTSGRVRLVSVVPSLDTGVCDMQTRRFNEEAARFPSVDVLTISMDLPFAQARWCGAAGVERVKTLSDHRHASFGQAYGVLIKELRLLARSIFVIDPDDVVRYVEIVPEVTNEPDYAGALAAVGQVAGS